ncbi:glycoside hydrolase family 3 N-terminal domain-containing protein [Microbacterium paraoxydans]|uniref:glycoside hydrolase family 3 N-terminal domain-containing protein n=1 Tax=Microbacterium paraoxydans TaxID=199592 RepID=UPI00301374EE
MTAIPLWRDAALPDAERLDALLAEMTLEEMVGQLHQTANLSPDDEHDRRLLESGGVGSTLLASGATAGNVRDAGVTRARTSALQRAARDARLGIPLLIARDVIHGHRTVFPIPLGLAASFDADLVRETGVRAALEASADGITWTFAPMIDLVEDPRWGRVAESFGESTLLNARLGAAMVEGIQRSGAVAACAKHYVGYGLSRGGRDYARVDVGEITLRNHHLIPFRAAVDAGVHTVMAAFSDVDGIPMHSHRHLIRDVLKGEWGFDGVVVADWNGIGELVAHGVARDLRAAAKLAIEAGVDVDMVSGAYSAHLTELVEAGDVDRELVMDAARRVLRLKLRLGLLDGDAQDPMRDRLDPAVGTPEPTIDRVLARRAAAASLVVLRDDALPVTGATGRVLLTGAYAHERASLMGTWVLDGDPNDVPTIADALAQRLLRDGPAPDLEIDDGAFPDRTLRRAREAEMVIALVGEHAIRSGEDSAAAHVGLPAGQLEVLRALRLVSTRLIVVVFAGRPLVLDEVHELADALVLAWQPGIEGAAAIVDLLTGRAPAMGRMPMTLPRSSGHLPFAHTERPSGRPLPDDPRGLGRYQDSPIAPLAAFGDGILPVRIGPLRGAGEVTRGGSPLVLEADVDNLGPLPLRVSVPLMMRAEHADITRPLRELIAVAVVEIPAHGNATARFTLATGAFGYVGRDLTFRDDVDAVDLWVEGAAEPLRHRVRVV